MKEQKARVRQREENSTQSLLDMKMEEGAMSQTV